MADTFDYYTHYNSFEEYVDMRRKTIVRKIKFNIRNYVFLSARQKYDLRILPEKDKIDIIILLNDMLSNLIETNYSSSSNDPNVRFPGIGSI